MVQSPLSLRESRVCVPSPSGRVEFVPSPSGRVEFVPSPSGRVEFVPSPSGRGLG